MHLNVIDYIIRGIIWFLEIMSFAIVINALLSWVMDPTHPLRSLLIRFVDPIVAPFRRITDKINTSGLPIDFSPILAIITIQIIITLLNNILLY